MPNEFEWDDRKNAANYEKHGILFEEAIRIFEGVCITRVDEREDYGELREITIGALSEMAVLVVVHTDRNGAIRIISARRASRREREIYSEHCTEKP